MHIQEARPPAAPAAAAGRPDLAGSSALAASQVPELLGSSETGLT